MQKFSVYDAISTRNTSIQPKLKEMYINNNDNNSNFWVNIIIMESALKVIIGDKIIAYCSARLG